MRLAPVTRQLFAAVVAFTTVYSIANLDVKVNTIFLGRHNAYIIVLMRRIDTLKFLTVAVVSFNDAPIVAKNSPIVNHFYPLK